MPLFEVKLVVHSSDDYSSECFTAKLIVDSDTEENAMIVARAKFIASTSDIVSRLEYRHVGIAHLVVELHENGTNFFEYCDAKFAALPEEEVDGILSRKGESVANEMGMFVINDFQKTVKHVFNEHARCHGKRAHEEGAYLEDVVDSESHPEGVWYNSDFRRFANSCLWTFAEEYLADWIKIAKLEVRSITSDVVFEWSGHRE